LEDLSVTIEFVFHFKSDKILIQDPQTGYNLEMSKRAVVLSKNKLLLALGETEEKVRARLSSRYEKRGDEIRTCTLFGPQGSELTFEIQAFQFFTRLLHSQSQKARGSAHFSAKLVDNFDYVLDIPGYETFSEARRQALEQGLQAHLRIRRLVINGQEVQIPMGKRNLEFWLRRLLCQALPIAAITAGYLVIPPAIARNPLSFLAYLMAIMYVFYYGGKTLWMALVRRLVPQEYRLCMLQGTRDRISKIDLWLARIVWGDHGDVT
jgi:hypothetical protein